MLDSEVGASIVLLNGAIRIFTTITHTHIHAYSGVTKVLTHHIVFEGETDIFSGTAIEASGRQTLGFLRVSRAGQSVQNHKGIPPPKKC